MIKQIITILLITASVQSGTAQDTTEVNKPKREIENRFYVSIEAGPCFPLGDYADRNLNNEKSGLALTGLAGRLKAGYAIRSHFWAVASGFYFYNPLDAKTLLNSITSNPNNPSELKYKVETDAWKVYGATVGLAARFDLDETDCELRGMVGIANATFATAHYTATDGTKTQFIDETADDALSFVIDLGVTFSLRISDKTGISVSGDLYSTQFDFENVTQKDEEGTVVNAGKYSQPVSVFQLTAGLYVKF